MSTLHKWYELQGYQCRAEAARCQHLIACHACAHEMGCVLVAGHEGEHRTEAGPHENYFHVWAKANKPEWYDRYINKTGEWAI